MNVDAMDADAADRLRNWADDYVTGTLSPADREAVERELLASEEARRFFVSYLELHAGLAWQFRGADCELPNLNEANPAHGADERSLAGNPTQHKPDAQASETAAPSRPERGKKVKSRQRIEGKRDILGLDFYDEVDGALYHLREWVDCVRTRKRPSCPAEDGVRSAAAAHLANLSYRQGAVARWSDI